MADDSHSAAPAPAARLRRRTDRVALDRYEALLDGESWLGPLESFGRATGIAISLFNAAGDRVAGPLAPPPVVRHLHENDGGGARAQACLECEARVARECIAAQAAVQGRAFDTLALFAIPIRQDAQTIGAITAGWVFDNFPEPVGTNRLAARVGLAFAALWQVVRQQSPISPERLRLYADVLQMFVDAFVQQRAQTLREHDRSHALRVLNECGTTLTGARNLADIADAVSRAALTLAPAADARFVVSAGTQPGSFEPARLPAHERRRVASNVLRVPIESADGSLLATIEVDEATRAHDTYYRAHLAALAAQAAVAFQKCSLIDDLVQERERLARANRHKDEFLSVLSHELRTPLTPILGWVTLLRQAATAPDAKTLTTALEVIERNARLELTLVEELLELTRIVNDKIVLEPELIDPSEAVLAAAAGARGLTDGAGVRIEAEFAEALPRIRADPKRLQQILSNLVSNAVKFTPAGGTIRIGARRAGKTFVDLYVADDGAGISAEALPRVFERFWQADSSATRRFGGLGIGLAVVRGLVEMQGGSVSAESDGEGKGATFVVRLPA